MTYNGPTIYKDAGGIGALPGDNVRMLLDTNGLELGPELITNSDILVAGDGLTDRAYRQASEPQETLGLCPVAEGKWYIVEWVATQAASGSSTFRIDGSGGVFPGGFNATTPLSGQVIGRAGRTGTLGINGDGDGSEAVFDKVSVRELTGLHADQPSTALQPVLVDQGNGYTAIRYDHVDDKLPQTYPEAKTGDLLICGRKGSWIDRDVSVAAGSSLSVISGKDSPKTPGIAPALGDIVGSLHAPRTLNDYEIAKLTEYWQERGAKGLLVPSGVEMWTGTPERIDPNWTDNGDGTFTSDGTKGFVGWSTGEKLEKGEAYFARMEIIANSNGGNFNLPYDGSGSNIRTLAAVGVHTRVFVAVTDDLFIYDNGGAGTIGNISVQKLVTQ